MSVLGPLCVYTRVSRRTHSVDRAEGWPRPSQIETAPVASCTALGYRLFPGCKPRWKLQVEDDREQRADRLQQRAGQVIRETLGFDKAWVKPLLWGQRLGALLPARRGHQPPRRPPVPVSLSPGTLSFRRNAAWRRRAAGSRAAKREGHQTPPDLPQLGGETRQMSVPGPVEELQGQRNNI